MLPDSALRPVRQRSAWFSRSPAGAGSRRRPTFRAVTCAFAAVLLLAGCWTLRRGPGARKLRRAFDSSRDFLSGTESSRFGSIPWVFTANGESSDAHVRMTKRSVLSLAATNGTLKPFCLYSGSREDPLAHWLRERGVHVTHHSPVWADRLWEDASHKLEQNARHSHLYSNKVALTSTFARIDIPLVKALRGYAYVLYTDNDVYFRGPITLEGLGELPRSVSMSYEMRNRFPYNAGVMVMNLQNLRASYGQFLDFILKRKGDMFFGMGYGPGDQGAYNFFYNNSLNFLSEDFNAKTYKPFNSEAKIVHFHGPKPEQYIEQLQTGRCSFNTAPRLCRQGLMSFCAYVDRDGYLSDSPQEAEALSKLC